MDLTSWIILWIVATAIAVVLGYCRMTVGLHDVMGMRIGEPDQAKFYQQQRSQQHKVIQLDRFGIAFTVISAALALVVVLVWATEQGAMS